MKKEEVIIAKRLLDDDDDNEDIFDLDAGTKIAVGLFMMLFSVGTLFILSHLNINLSAPSHSILGFVFGLLSIVFIGFVIISLVTGFMLVLLGLLEAGITILFGRKS